MTQFLLFAEYPIKKTEWQAYKDKIPQLRLLSQKVEASNHTFAESVDQPCVIVETIYLQTEKHSQQFQKEHSDIIESHIDGGRSKVKYWLFRSFS